MNEAKPRTARPPTFARQASTFVLLALASFVLGLPFFWMMLTSLKPPSEITAYPPRWWPGAFVWQNYADAWSAAPFDRFFWNSLVTGIGTTALQVGLALTMAYAFVFLRFPGKRILFLVILSTMMIPEEMKLIPNYLFLERVHWVDTYWALVIPPAAHAFPVFVFHEHFRVLPRDFIEAARMDGAGHIRTLCTVVVPLCRPVLAAVLLITFVGRWNDYLWPLVATNREAMRTLPVGLAYLRETQEGMVQWNILMAGSVFVIIPILILFVFAQRQFVLGITQGALKS